MFCYLLSVTSPDSAIQNLIITEDSYFGDWAIKCGDRMIGKFPTHKEALRFIVDLDGDMLTLDKVTRIDFEDYSKELTIDNGQVTFK